MFVAVSCLASLFIRNIFVNFSALFLVLMKIAAKSLVCVFRFFLKEFRSRSLTHTDIVLDGTN